MERGIRMSLIFRKPTAMRILSILLLVCLSGANQAVQTDIQVAAWASRFAAAMDECKLVWEQRWADDFTLGNAHFSGNLSELKTCDPTLVQADHHPQ